MLRILTTMLVGGLLLTALGCGGATAPIVDNEVPLPSGGAINPLPSTDFEFDFDDDNDRGVSALFNYYFHDAVNQHSGARWTVENLGGSKFWKLSNTFFSAPKAWQMGGNYWNNENDILTSNAGTVPAGRKGIKLGYHGRWRIAEGDGCSVQYSIDGGQWTELGFFTGGQNPSFPDWDRYTFYLPDCGPADQQYQCRFVFTSDANGQDAGFGVDRVAIYQTRIPPPLNVDATDENADAITVTWLRNNDGERAGFYDVYRSDTEFGTYTLIGSTTNPDHDYDDASGTPNTEYWFKVKGRKTGWDDSDFSNADSGSYFNNN